MAEQVMQNWTNTRVKSFFEQGRVCSGGVLGIRRPLQFRPVSIRSLSNRAKAVRITDADGTATSILLCSYVPSFWGTGEAKWTKP